VNFLVDFLNFLLNSIYSVPLEISIGSATILTFLWLVDKIFSRLSVWRTVVITVWGMILLDFFIPIGNLRKEQLWLIVILVGIVVAVTQWVLRPIRAWKERKSVRPS